MVREERRVLFPSTVCQGTRTRPRLGEVAENQQPFFDTHGGFFGSYISTKKKSAVCEMGTSPACKCLLGRAKS